VTRLAGALCAMLLWTGCGADESAMGESTGPMGTAEAGLSTPVLNGTLPGLSQQVAREIAVQNFNAVSPWAAYAPHQVDQTHLWAYQPEGYYYIEGYTVIEQCGGYVYESGAFVLSYCYTRSIGL
jgi:hypothetical protein